MSDRTTVNYAMSLDHEPSEDEKARLRLIVEKFGAPEVCEHHGAPGSWDLWGYVPEGRYGDEAEIATRLREDFDGVTAVRCWSEPSYEFLGTLRAWRAGQAEFGEAQCDADGTPVYSPQDLAKLVGETFGRDELVAAIEGLDL